MKATFENSVSVLVRAYLNDTLKHSTCTACAVTNLCGGWQGWTKYFITLSDVDDLRRRFNFEQRVGLLDPDGQDRTELKRIGYSVDQLRQIEWAFETAPQGHSDDDWMFNGLMAVVDVLAKIHNVDLTAKEQAIGQFKEVQLSKV